MDKLSLTILLHDRIASILSDISNSHMPQGVTLAVNQINSEGCADNADTVLITDDATLATRVLSDEFSRLELVYIGDITNIVDSESPLPKRLLCAWDAQAAAQHAAGLVEQLAARLKDRYDAWLYKTWLLSLIDSLPDLVWYKEKSGLHNLVNQEFCKTVHRTREDCIDKGHCYIWNAPPESEYQCAETDNAVMSGGTTVIADEKVETDKGIRQFRTYKSPVHDRDGAIMGTVGLAHDVTDFTNMGMELQILVNSLPFPVALADNNWSLISSNARFRRAFAMSEAQVHGLDYLSWKKALSTRTHTHIAPSGEKVVAQDLVARNEDNLRFYELTEPEIVDYFDNVSGHYCLFRDVTVEREFERQTLAYANTDPLTGLANRRSFYAYLSEHTGKPITILNIDLDNFKKVNDTYGHAVGDTILERIARLFEEVAPNAMLARQGGDEFVCALDTILSDDETKAYVDKICKRVENEFKHLNVGLGCSIGTACVRELPDDPEEILHIADKNMYEVKARRHHFR